MILASCTNHSTGAPACHLACGADPNARLPVHAHATPLHTAALHDDVEMMKLLIARGAKHDTRDTLWNATPLGWAVHNKRRNAESYLRALAR
jgi:ankyrin repeat protein